MSFYEKSEAFVEPEGFKNAGERLIRHLASPYERYMERQNIPIHSGPGFFDVRELERRPWANTGGNGAFLVPDGTVDTLGVHIIEIPPRGALEPERHLYDEVYWVIEGRGSTEMWQHDSDRHQRFEWRAGSLFAAPMNTWHQLVNASSEPALLISGNNGPLAMSIYDSEQFIFDNDFVFQDRFDPSDDDYFKPLTETVRTPDANRAMWQTNIVPDIIHTALPLDNQRAPGYRRIEPHMGRGRMLTFLGEYESGRYSKAHYHPSGAVLICVKGRGYTVNWPQESGQRPWENGKADTVERTDYGFAGMVAAAPGRGNWFHQHFEVSKEPLRFLVIVGGLPGRHLSAHTRRLGEKHDGVSANWNIEDGGASISYKNEDPYIREEYKRMLKDDGVEFRMPDEIYE